MTKVLDTRAYLDTVCELLQSGASSVPVTVAGTSMTPYLDPGDTVLLDLGKEGAKIGDVILFRRRSGQYVLHRVISISPDGRLELLGDAQILSEWIDPDQVRAVVTGVRRGERYLDAHSLRWKFFQDPWRHIRRSRPLINRIRNHFKA